MPFLGLLLTDSGVKPDPNKVNALRSFPEPKSIKELRSFLGLIEFVGHKFVKNFSETSAYLYSLTRVDNFTWDDKARTSFYELQNLISEITVLQYFDPNKPVILQTDASGVGIGGVLIQNSKPIIYCSRKLSTNEMKYSQIEREFLAIYFSIVRLRSFLIGNTFTVQTDNKALITFFNKSIHMLPHRIQKWMIYIIPFSYNVQHISGSKNKIADALSRYPNDHSIPNQNEEDIYVYFIIDSKISEATLIEKTKLDEEIQEVIYHVKNGWHDKKAKFKLPYYYKLRNNLSVNQSGLLFNQQQLCVPHSIRKDILRLQHEGHMGIISTKSTLRLQFFLAWNVKRY